MPEALRTRLVDVNARLGRIKPWPWQAIHGGVIAPPVRVSLPRPYLEGLNIGRSSMLEHIDALDDIEYYGGELVCESCRTPDAEFIAHAPADLAVLADATLLLLRDRDRLRHLMHKFGIRSRTQIDIEIRSEGGGLFTIARAELPRIGLEA
jgi:hypothetical protein